MCSWKTSWNSTIFRSCDDFLWQVHHVVRSNNLSLRTNIDPTRNNELSSTMFSKYKQNNKKKMGLLIKHKKRLNLSDTFSLMWERCRFFENFTRAFSLKWEYLAWTRIPVAKLAFSTLLWILRPSNFLFLS